MGSSGTEYVPSSLVATVRVKPVPVFLMVTVAPAMASPEESVTVPRNVWASAEDSPLRSHAASKQQVKPTHARRTNLFIELSLRQSEYIFSRIRSRRSPEAAAVTHRLR